jgi:hypothetical protein
MVAAVRELYEETGIDLRPYLPVASLSTSNPVDALLNVDTTDTAVVGQQQQPVRILPLQLYDARLYDETISTDATTTATSSRNNNIMDDTGMTEDQHHLLSNEYKHRLFYTVVLTDDHFDNGIVVKSNKESPPTTNTCCDSDIPSSTNMHSPIPPPHIRLRLSQEHSGYTFIKDIHTIYSMIGLHSGGAIAEAFRKACGQIQSKRDGSNNNNNDPWNRILTGFNTVDNNNNYNNNPHSILWTNHQQRHDDVDDESKLEIGDHNDDDDDYE